MTLRFQQNFHYARPLRENDSFGSFGGRDWIAQPWDSIIVGAIGAIGYLWGVAEAVRFLHSQATEPAQSL